MPPIDIAIVSGRPLLADGLEALLVRDARFRVVARHACWATASILFSSMDVDVALATLECVTHETMIVRQTVVAVSRPRLIVIADERDEVDLKMLMRRGVAGVVLTTMSSALLALSILKVHEGEIWLEKHSVLQHLREETMMPAIRSLSDRESEIVRGVCAGLRNHDIADRLCISESTVKTHVSHIFSKLHVRSRVELCLMAQKWRAASGIFTPLVAAALLC